MSLCERTGSNGKTLKTLLLPAGRCLACGMNSSGNVMNSSGKTLLLPAGRLPGTSLLGLRYLIWCATVHMCSLWDESNGKTLKTLLRENTENTAASSGKNTAEQQHAYSEYGKEYGHLFWEKKNHGIKQRECHEQQHCCFQREGFRKHASWD